MTPEEYNFITEEELNIIRERIARFSYMDLKNFVDLVLICFINQITDNQLSSTNTLIITPSKKFTFCNNYYCEFASSINIKGLVKLCREYNEACYQTKDTPEGCKTILDLDLFHEKFEVFFVKPRVLVV